MSSRRRAATIYTDCPANKPHSAIVNGPARIVTPALRTLQVAWMWDHAGRGWLVPRNRLCDVEALLTSNGHDVRPRAQVLL